MKLGKVAYDLTAVTMGIHALERARNDGNSLLDSEGLVPIWIECELVRPRQYSDWEAVTWDLKQLAADVAVVAEGERKTFLQGMIRSLQLAVSLFPVAALPSSRRSPVLSGRRADMRMPA